MCDIKLNENEIKNMKKVAFKKLVNSQLRIKAEEFLSSLRNVHSKTKNMKSYKFQTYLECSELSVDEKRLLFQFRTRSIVTK